jgi:hypothetical protein
MRYEQSEQIDSNVMNEFLQLSELKTETDEEEDSTFFSKLD